MSSFPIEERLFDPWSQIVTRGVNPAAVKASIVRVAMSCDDLYTVKGCRVAIPLVMLHQFMFNIWAIV